MIRYRFAGLDVQLGQAAACDHPRLARLRTCGPWKAELVDGQVQLEQQVAGWTAEGWGEWQTRGDSSYQIASNAALTPLRRSDLPSEAVWLHFANGEHAPVAPAYAEGLDVDMDGKVLPTGPGPYCRALDAFIDRGSSATHAEALPLCYEAIKSCHRCPAELSHGLRLMTYADIPRMVQAAYGTVGKAEPAAAG